VLEQDFEPFLRRGQTCLEVVREADGRWLRLVDPESKTLPSQLVARLATYRLAQLVLGALGDAIGSAVEDAFAALRRSKRSKAEKRLVSRVGRDLDRLLYFRPHGGKDYRAKADVLKALLRALVQHKRISLSYEASRGVAAEHDLEPLTLALYQGGLHLLARYSGQKRVYNFVVDRMESIQVRGSTFAYPLETEYQPDEILSSSFGIFFKAKEGKQELVKLVFAAKAWLQVYLLERRWHSTQKFRQLGDGRLELTFRLGNLVEVATWVRGFGEDVEVVAPHGLRDL
jgi:predicted DNA-binding transcriptional regulator YafY